MNDDITQAEDKKAEDVKDETNKDSNDKEDGNRDEENNAEENKAEDMPNETVQVAQSQSQDGQVENTEAKDKDQLVDEENKVKGQQQEDEN